MTIYLQLLLTAIAQSNRALLQLQPLLSILISKLARMERPKGPKSSLPRFVRRLLPWYPQNYKQTSFDHRFHRVRPRLIDNLVNQGILIYDFAHLKGDGRPNLLPGKYGNFEFWELRGHIIPGLEGMYENFRTALMPCALCQRPHPHLEPWPQYDAEGNEIPPVGGYSLAWEAKLERRRQILQAQQQREGRGGHVDSHDGEQRIRVRSNGMTWRDE